MLMLPHSRSSTQKISSADLPHSDGIYVSNKNAAIAVLNPTTAALEKLFLSTLLKLEINKRTTAFLA
jgi:hypothetical protein